MKKSFLSKSISLALISTLLGCGSGGGEDGSQQAQNQQNPPAPNISQLSYFPYYAESPTILPLFQLNEEISNVGKDFSIVSRIVEVVRGLDFHDYINRKTPHISSRYKNLTATSKRKSFVSQYERIKRNASDSIIRTQASEMNQLVFNSGYADTSHINNKTLLSQLFDYNRLERDKNINSVVDHTHNVKDNGELSKLMNQNARIMVLDTGFGNVLGLDEDRIIERWIDDNKGERVIPDTPYHGDKVLTQLFVDQNYTGLMRDKGNIYFIGVYSNTPNIYEAYRSPYIEEGLKLGYNIFNASWLYYLDENKGKHLNESWIDWFKRGKFSESPHYLSARKIVDGLNEYAKQDLLFVNALGNEREEGNISYIGYYLLDNKDRLKPLLNSTIFVGGYRLDKQTLPSYANRCDDLKYYCLVANDEVVAYYRDDEGALWAYKEYGSSFSTPLVSATAGLLKSVYPFMTNENLQTTILTTAEDLGIKGVDKDYGWGLLRTDRAVNGPMQFWDKDFIVNLSHNQSQQNKAIYNFSNDISGQYGLTVTGDQNKKNALSLSGFNTYQGDTTVKAGGILNIDGVLTHSHTRILNGSVYGSGLLSDVTNAGNLYAYSLYRYTDPTSTRSQFGMIIDGNYTQDIKGNLFVLLGQPLAVTGNVSLDGRLVVNGVKRGYVSNFGKVFGDVIVAKGNITGSFKDVKVLSKFLSYDDISYNTLNVGDEVISTVSVYATYKGLAENLDLFTSVYDPFYDIAKSTANTLDNLNQKINEQVAKNEVFESPALDLMADIQSADVAEVKQAVKALSGSEYAETTDWHDYYADKKAFLNRINNLSIRQGVSYDYQQGHGLTVQYGENDLQYGVGVFESRYDDTRHNGVNLNLNKDLNGFNLISSFNYEQLKTDLTRHTELFSQSYANGLKLKQRHYGVGLTLNKMFEWNNHQFNLFTGYDFRRQQLKGIEENIGVKLGYQTQYHNDHNLTFGVGYNWSWLNFNLGLNYAHLVHLNHNNIQGYLKDDMVYSDHTILKHKDKHTDFWQATLSYQWDKVNLGLNYTHSTKDRNVGAKIELTF